MLAVLALSTVSTGAGQSATTGIVEQDQATQAAEHLQDKLTLEPVHPGFPIGPIIISPAAWREFILETPLPQEACSTATYPDLQWQVVSCGGAYLFTPESRILEPATAANALTVGAVAQ